MVGGARLNNGWHFYFLSKPWLDRWCLWGLRQMLVSGRAWAAASVSEGDPELFFKELNIDNPPASWRDKIAPLLRETMELAGRQRETTQQWHDTAFGTPSNIAQAEQARRQASNAYWMQRWVYKKFANQCKIAPVKLLPLKEELLGSIQNDTFFKMPSSLPELKRSQAIEHAEGIREYWLSWNNSNETIYAHVYEPIQLLHNIPSFIYGHGLAMETEMLAIPDTLYKAWALSGMRVILPDAPGHNRRVKPGWYGGESFLCQPPFSNLTHFSKVSEELAILIAWAHGESNGKVALGGISLGALSAQIAAHYTKNASSNFQPDALMLATTTAFVSRLGEESSIARITGLHKATAAWQNEDKDRLHHLVDVKGPPPLNPKNIVMLLGKYDNVTPFLGGLQLAKEWQIPDKNLYVRRQGHFSAAFGLQYDWSPVERLLKILSL